MKLLDMYIHLHLYMLYWPLALWNTIMSSLQHGIRARLSNPNPSPIHYSPPPPPPSALPVLALFFLRVLRISPALPLLPFVGCCWHAPEGLGFDVADLDPPSGRLGSAAAAPDPQPTRPRASSSAPGRDASQACLRLLPLAPSPLRPLLTPDGPLAAAADSSSLPGALPRCPLRVFLCSGPRLRPSLSDRCLSPPAAARFVILFPNSTASYLVLH